MSVSPIEKRVTLTDIFGKPLPEGQGLVAASIEKLTEIFPNPKNRLSAMVAVRTVFLNNHHISQLSSEIEPLLKEGRKERLDEAIVLLTAGYTTDRNRKESSQWDLEINKLQSLVEAAQTALQTNP